MSMELVGKAAEAATDLKEAERVLADAVNNKRGYTAVKEAFEKLISLKNEHTIAIANMHRDRHEAASKLHRDRFRELREHWQGEVDRTRWTALVCGVVVGAAVGSIVTMYL